jgi:ribonuclease HII
MLLPDLSFEKEIWQRGFNFVGGVDEVGRGCFAGPVVTGCVVFPKEIKVTNGVYINDSKKLTTKLRYDAAIWIKNNAISWGVGVGSVAEINNRGIVAATSSAFRRAIQNANKRTQTRIDYLLIDAFYIRNINGLRMPIKTARKNGNRNDGNARQLAVVKGDQKILSVAAASIIAKVYRDSLMESIGMRSFYKKYGWEKNKGYGTKRHRNAILRYGVTRYHRKKFVSTFLAKNQN